MPLTPTIGLNALLLPPSQEGYRSAGIATYIQNILAQVLPDPQFRYWIYGDPGIASTRLPNPLPPWAALAPARTPSPVIRILWEQCVQPILAIRHHLALLHSMSFVSPMLGRIPSVVTMYDLSFVHFPDRFRAMRRAYLTLFTRISCQRATRIIAISESTKRDVVQTYGIDPKKVDVIYPGCDPRFVPQSPVAVAAFREKHGLPDRYILYLGTIEPRKNLSVLIAAFARVQKMGVKLVCAGGLGWQYDDVFRTVAELGLSSDVLFPGFVSAADLPLWYAASDLFVYPSHYEGFGMPVVEAMACGVPVITTNVSALPEAAGEAGWLVPPADRDALAEAMGYVLENPSLAQQRVVAGIRHAARFQWATSGQQTLATYQQALV